MKHLKQIKSFVKRNGRLTSDQKSSLAHNFKIYGLEKVKYNFVEIFGNNNPVILDIGFGSGDDLFLQALNNPQYNFIGAEVYLSGINSVLSRVVEHDLKNIRLIYGDAVEYMTECIAKESLARIQLMFPDPWPKKRHHKRRIVQNKFIEMVTDLLQQDGVFHVATDWDDYAVHIQDVMARQDKLIKTSVENDKGVYLIREVTRFEQKGLNKGHQISDLIYIKD